MSKSRLFLACSTLALTTTLLASTPAWADFQAQLSASEVGVGEPFALVLRSDGGTPQAAPDLSPLTADFDILGTNQSSQIQVVNGARSSSVSWLIDLAAKQAGKATIPPITLGAEQTQALSIDVVTAAKAQAANPLAAGIAVELTTDQASHYVHEEIPVTVRIYPTPGMRSAALEEPTGTGFTLTRHGDDSQGRAMRDGHEVEVIERHYLLQPQQSGPLTIPPLTLRATIKDPSHQRSPFGSLLDRMPFGGAGFGTSMFDDMMNPGQQVVVRSAPLTLDIKPRPGASDGWFLPAKNVKLLATWQPEQPVFKVGETVTRKIQLMALGAGKEQLPDIDVTGGSGARIYLDRTDDSSIDTKDGIAAVREFVTSIVPTQGGELTLPAIEVRWWDTVADTERTAILPAETFQVEGPMAAMAPSASLPEPAKPAIAETDAWPSADSLVGGFATLAAGIGGWWFWRRRVRGTVAEATRGTPPLMNVDPNELANLAKQAASDLRQACSRNDANAAYAAFLRWRKCASLKPAAGPVDPCRLSPALAAELAKLEQTLYAQSAGQSPAQGAAQPPGQSWQGSSFWGVFARVRDELRASTKAEARFDKLPPLYPQAQSAA